MKRAPFIGSGVALVTPFDEEENVNYKVLDELIEFQIANNTDAIIICGTTGEATTMSEDEKKETIKFTVDVIKNRIPVIAGTGSNDTTKSINMSKYAESVGVDALLIITPYYNKTNNEGLIKHLESINNAVNIPIIAYNVPSRTNVNITPEQLLRLSSLNNIVAIKEASGNISQVAKMKTLCGDKIDIYSGNDDQIIPIMSLGGLGVISVAANIVPKVIHNITSEFLSGNYNDALKLQLDYLELCNVLFIETNPIPIKTALNLLSKNVGNLRLPLYKMDNRNKDKLIKTLESYNLI